MSQATYSSRVDVMTRTIEQPLRSYDYVGDSVSNSNMHGLEAFGMMFPSTTMSYALPLAQSMSASVSSSLDMYEQVPSFSMLPAIEGEDDSARFEALYARYFEM